MTKHSSQRIIIVGATSGIGREVALLLLKEGHQLGLAGRRAGRTTQGVAEAGSGSHLHPQH